MSRSTAKLASLATAAASALGAPLDASTADRVAIWLGQLEAWNARIDLTAARNREELVDIMLADALVLAARLAHTASLVDVGAGAGAPGLALAILRPDLAVTLVEPNGKRASFLRSIIGELRLEGVGIDRVRGDALGTRASRRWHAAVSRATLPPAAWLDLATTLVAPGGIIWVLVAGEDPPSHPHAAPETDLAYTWPLTGARRRALAYRERGRPLQRAPT